MWTTVALAAFTAAFIVVELTGVWMVRPARSLRALPRLRAGVLLAGIAPVLGACSVLLSVWAMPGSFVWRAVVSLLLSIGVLLLGSLMLGHYERLLDRRLAALRARQATGTGA